MLSMPISAIVPCYNGLPHVFEAVESVLEQADDTVECLVVDDGSTDGSAETIARRFGNRVRLLRQANAGVSTARNRGLAETSGELVIWLDADDRLLPDTLDFRRQAFRDDPTLEMLLGVNTWENRHTGAMEAAPRTCPPDYLQSGLLARRDLPHLNAFTFRRTALARIGPFDSQLRTSEDYDLWLRAWACLRWRFVDRVLSWQRTGNRESLARRTPPLNKYLDHGWALEKNREPLQQTLGTDRPWRKAYSRWATNLALVHLRRGERREAAEMALRAIGMARGWAELRAYKYLLEGLLPSRLYRLGARALGRPAN